METYGCYSLSFNPAGGGVSPSIHMDISGEADLGEMLSLFDSFLKANGYVYDGELQIVKEREPLVPYDSQDFWREDGISLTGNPYAPVYSNDTISFTGSGVLGGMYDGVVTLG